MTLRLQPNYEIKSEHLGESDTTIWILSSCRISLCGAQSSTSVYFSLASLYTPVEEFEFTGYTQNYMDSPQNKSVQLFTESLLCTKSSPSSSFLCLGLHYESFLDPKEHHNAKRNNWITKSNPNTQEKVTQHHGHWILAEFLYVGHNPQLRCASL